MLPKERIRTIRLMERLFEQPELCCRLGLDPEMKKSSVVYQNEDTND